MTNFTCFLSILIVLPDVYRIVDVSSQCINITESIKPCRY